MRVASHVLALAVAVSGLLVPADRASAQRAGAADSTRRRTTAGEYQAQRRQWLEAQRARAAALPAYGSARVGAGGRTAEGVIAGVVAEPSLYPLPGFPGTTPSGWSAVRCQGWAGPELRWRGQPGGSFSFEGECLPAGWSPGWYGAQPPHGSSFGPWGVPRGAPGGDPSRGWGPPWAGPAAPGWGALPGWDPSFDGSRAPFDRFGPPFDPWGGGWAPGAYDGIREYGWSGWGWSPFVGGGWMSGPGSGYGLAPWPGAGGSECARIVFTSATGRSHEIMIAVRALGIADVADLDLAIDARLSRGESVDLVGVDGRRLVLTPGAALDDIRVVPCGTG